MTEQETGYTPEHKDRGYFHAIIYKPYFNPRSGKDESIKDPQMFTPEEWYKVRDYHLQNGFTVEVLYEPK